MNARVARLYNKAVMKLRGWDYYSSLRELEELQWAPPERIREHQNQKLCNLLLHCAQNVPFYRSRLEDLEATTVGRDPRERLRRLPVITKALLRQDYQRFHASSGRKSDVWASSGSTGEPFHFCRDKASIASNTFASLARGLSWWGLEVGSPSAMLWSGVRGIHGSSSSSVLAARRRASWRLKNIWLVDVYELQEQAARKTFNDLLKFKPKFIRGISSGVFRLCSLFDQLRLDGRELGLQCAVYTGEVMLPSQKLVVERVLGCKAVCEYGCTELGVIAFECPAGGLHLSHENLIIEHLDQEHSAGGGGQVPVVVTDLDNHVAPLVRYEVGDLVVPRVNMCACGRTLPLISEILGRSHDAIVTPSGSTIHALYFTHLFDRITCVHQFRVTQDRIDTLRMELKSPRGIPAGDIEAVRRAIEAIMGDGVAVEVVQVSDIPASSSGKTPWVVSRIGQANA